MRRPDTKYVTSGGAEVAYQVLGDGPLDLVYHHGMCHLDFQWDVPPEAAFVNDLAAITVPTLVLRNDSRGIDYRAEEIPGAKVVDVANDEQPVLVPAR